MKTIDLDRLGGQHGVSICETEAEGLLVVVDDVAYPAQQVRELMLPISAGARPASLAEAVGYLQHRTIDLRDAGARDFPAPTEHLLSIAPALLDVLQFAHSGADGAQVNENPSTPRTPPGIAEVRLISQEQVERRDALDARIEADLERGGRRWWKRLLRRRS